MFLINCFAQSSHLNKKWNRTWILNSKQESLNNLIKILKLTATGKVVISKAQIKYKNNLLNLIRVGDTSITDTSLLRSFYPDSSEISYQEISSIFINKDLNLKDAVLDLAHELTHYTYRKFFNPYEKNYSTISYVKRTIEGQGGEVDAFIVECKVRKELFGNNALLENQCGSIIENKKLNKLKAVKLFYQMGKYYSKFVELTDSIGDKEEYQFINSKNYRFISSAFSMPYPLAAVIEYKAIKTKICNTNKRRIKSFQKELRKPASFSRRSPSSSVVMNLKIQYKKRCL